MREPELGDAALLALLAAARERLDAAGAPGWLAVHDRPHLAGAAAAQAVHLGFRSLAAADARALLPAEVAVGFSAHAGDDEELREGADYLLFGPVNATPSKRGKVAPVGLDGLRREAARERRPLWALGGLRPEDVAPAAEAGARGVASLSGVFGAGEVGERVAAWLRAVEAAPFR